MAVERILILKFFHFKVKGFEPFFSAGQVLSDLFAKSLSFIIFKRIVTRIKTFSDALINLLESCPSLSFRLSHIETLRMPIVCLFEGLMIGHDFIALIDAVMS